MTNDHIINKCIILSPGYSSSYTLATNWFAWGSHHPGKHKQNQKCWRTYGIHTTLCIKMSEVKCKILLSMEIIMSYFRTLGEAAGFLLPPLISKFFSESWRPKKDGQILVNLVEKQSGKQKNNASILFMKDKDQQPMETHSHVCPHGPRYAPSETKHLLLPSLLSQTLNSQSAPLL